MKAFASDNATVVIGTSLDPDMADEIRVTVVATGIGNERKPDITLVAGGKAKPAQAAQSAPVTTQQPVAAKEEKVAPTLQNPSVQQSAAETSPAPSQPASPSVGSAGAQTAAAPKQEKENGYLDIPAFLRRQAD